jgi:erythromycin esterase-like protein
VLRYLEQVDPAAAGEARKRYACFDHYDEDSQAYGHAATFGVSESCQNAVIAQLQHLHEQAGRYKDSDGASAHDAFFYAQQNARLVMNAEKYYRTMFHGRVASWNLRDQHMAETLDALATHLSAANGAPAKIVVWAHNSHVGDARATEVQGLGEWNVGQLARERYGDIARLIGFSTYQGWVTAASSWDGPAERKRVLPALPGSVEALLHNALPGNFILPLMAGTSAAQALDARKLERAIGVLYLPRTERQSHYFHASLPRQFDAVIHFDVTGALTPLEVMGRPGAEFPETYPEGI